MEFDPASFCGTVFLRYSELNKRSSDKIENYNKAFYECVSQLPRRLTKAEADVVCEMLEILRNEEGIYE